MLRIFDFRWWKVWLGLMLAAHTASAFSLLGPPESWQTTTLGYEKQVFVTFPADAWRISFDDFAYHPHNLGEEFRWNTPQLYYAVDQSFLDYFGSNGVAAVDAAAAILNGLTNVSSFSPNLTEFPLDESRINFTAAALHLYDLKSAVLELLVERLGLIDPENWTWALRSRILPVGLACPQFDFAVIQRNFDPITWEPSRYVNGTLFTYEIEQSCPPAEDFGDAVEFMVDPSGGTRFTAVATPKITLPDPTFWGYFHTSLTRDDAGGLRYLYATNNVNWESMSPDSVLLYTNIAGGQQLLITSNLTLLAQQALTNDPVTLQALYPTLQIISSTNVFTNIWVTNITGYFTNSPYDPYGTPPHLVLVTNRTLTVQTYFHYIFGNVVTIVFTNGAWTTVPLPDINTHISREWLTVQSTYTTNSPYDAFGTPPHTNTSSFTYAIYTVAGDYYIVPTNLCGIAISALQATLVTSQTNVVAAFTNLPPGLTNAQSFTQVVINYATNHAFTYYPVDCVSSNTGLFQGIEKVTFIKANYDSLLGRFFAPITNYYHLNAVTNSTVVRQTIRRVVTQPDILIQASDLTGVHYPDVETVLRSTPNYSTNGVLAGNAGPGTIQGPVLIQLNKVGPIFLNGTYPSFVDETGAILDFIWGSFDGTTNAPIIYPSGTSIMNLENQVLIQVLPPYLPDGKVGTSYAAQISTVAATPNWQSPYTFGLAAGSQGLPPGLNLSASGGIAGTPTQAGFYNFVIQVTDAVGRKIQQSYVINIF